jgi:hypothetical protein
MRLEAPEVTQLPLAAALVDNQGRVIATSPEWAGPAPGTVSFQTGYAQLLVAVDAAPPALDVLMSRLLDELAAASHQPDIDGLRVELLAAGLLLVAGHPLGADDRGQASHVFQLAQAGITARTQGVEVEAQAPPPLEVPAPAAIALALVQFAVNANRHEHAHRVNLRVTPGPTFYVEWESQRSGGVAVETHRHQERRGRWGWGYVQTVADALGAAALPPGPTGPHRQGACLGLGSIRLTLPLACIESGRVTRSTESWDHDVHVAFGHQINGELATLVQEAQAQPGHIVAADLYRARATGPRTWLAMPPQNGANRARDVLRGLVHERALVRAPEPHATRIYALATLLEAALSDHWPSVPPTIWQEIFPQACAALGIPTPPPIEALVLPDPRATAFLLVELRGHLVEMGDELRLVPGPQPNEHLLRALPRDEQGRVCLSA